MSSSVEWGEKARGQAARSALGSQARPGLTHRGTADCRAAGGRGVPRRTAPASGQGCSAPPPFPALGPGVASGARFTSRRLQTPAVSAGTARVAGVPARKVVTLRTADPGQRTSPGREEIPARGPPGSTNAAAAERRRPGLRSPPAPARQWRAVTLYPESHGGLFLSNLRAERFQESVVANEKRVSLYRRRKGPLPGLAGVRRS